MVGKVFEPVTPVIRPTYKCRADFTPLCMRQHPYTTMTCVCVLACAGIEVIVGKLLTDKATL